MGNKFDKAVSSRYEDNSNPPIKEEQNIPQEPETLEQTQVPVKETITISNPNTDNTEALVNQEIVLVNTDSSFESLQIECIKELENLITVENTKQFGQAAKKKKKIRFSDKYVPAMISIRARILRYIEDIEENSVYTKAEVIDRLLINGIKNTKFDE